MLFTCKFIYNEEEEQRIDSGFKNFFASFLGEKYGTEDPLKFIVDMGKSSSLLLKLLKCY